MSADDLRARVRLLLEGIEAGTARFMSDYERQGEGTTRRISGTAAAMIVAERAQIAVDLRAILAATDPAPDEALHNHLTGPFQPPSPLCPACTTPPSEGATRCEGSGSCTAPLHVHGCYADLDGSACDDPTDHRAPVHAGDEGVRLTEDSGLAEKWASASLAARKADHHWPADCLSEAVLVVRHLTEQLAAAEARLGEGVVLWGVRCCDSIWNFATKEIAASWRESTDHADATLVTRTVHTSPWVDVSE